MEPPIVDILVPTYEPRPEHVREALASIRSQTESRFTCLIHDDCSQADVARIVAPFLADERFTFVRSPRRLGIGGNWNACLQQGGNAPFVAYLFHDDRWEQAYLERGLRVFAKHPSVGFLSVDHAYFMEGTNGNEGRYRELETFKRTEIKPGFHPGGEILQWWILRELHPNIIGEPPFVLFRRSTLGEVGPWDGKMPQFLDVEYWVRCLQVTDWYYLAETLGSFRVHPGGASARNERSGAGIYDRLECFERLIRSLPPGPLRTSAVATRNRALTTMARKYFARRREGKSVKSSAKRFMIGFALRHPILVGRAALHAHLPVRSHETMER